MYRTIITSAAVAVAALAIVAGASAAVNSPVACLYAMPTSLIQAQVCGSAPYGTRSVAAVKVTPPVACRYAMPTSRAEAIACTSRNVNAPLSPAVLAGIKKAHASAKGQGLSPDVRQEIYDANQRIAAAVPAFSSKSQALSETARLAIYDANHRESESVPTTSSNSPTYLQEGLDPAIATAIAAKDRGSYDPTGAIQRRHAAAAALSTPSGSPLLEGGVDSVQQQIRDAQAANAAAASSVSSGSSFNWGSAGIGAVAGALLLIAAVGSGALMRRRRQPLHA